MQKLVINIIISFIMWFVKQPWFQLAVVKFVTAAVENTKTDMDDKILNFIIEHQDYLIPIANKEASKITSKIDERLAKAIEDASPKCKK